MKHASMIFAAIAFLLSVDPAQATEQQDIVSVGGAVKKCGPYPRIENESLAELVNRLGGIAVTQADLDVFLAGNRLPRFSIMICRNAKKRSLEIDPKSTEMWDLKILPNDAIEFVRVEAFGGVEYPATVMLKRPESMILKPGESIENAVKAMDAAKHDGKARYSPIELSMVTLRKDSALRIWRVDRGVLIVQYSTVSKLIEELSFELCETYEQAAKVEFRFAVRTFDVESGLMEIQTQSPIEAFQPSKEEQRATMERIQKRLQEMEKESEAGQTGPKNDAKPAPERHSSEK